MSSKAKLSLAIAAIFAAGTANANPIQVSDIFLEASAQATNGAGETDSASESDAADVRAVASLFRFGEVMTHRASAFANDTGGFGTDVEITDLGSVNAGLAQYYTVTNSGDVAQDVFFDFRIEDGEISTLCFDFSGYDGSEESLDNSASSNECPSYTQNASYVAEILVDGTSIFDSSTVLNSQNGQNSMVQEGVALAVDNDPTDGRFSWEEQIFNNYGLGILQPGQSVQLIYNITAAANISAPNSNIEFAPFSVGFNAGTRFSDPFNFFGIAQASFTSVDVQADPVNAPATVGLFGMALLALRARRFRKALGLSQA